MRRRWYLEVIGRGTQHARSFDHALQLAEKAEGTWRILMRVGAGDTVLVRQGVNRAAA